MRVELRSPSAVMSVVRKNLSSRERVWGWRSYVPLAIVGFCRGAPCGCPVRGCLVPGWHGIKSGTRKGRPYRIFGVVDPSRRVVRDVPVDPVQGFCVVDDVFVIMALPKAANNRRPTGMCSPARVCNAPWSTICMPPPHPPP